MPSRPLVKARRAVFLAAVVALTLIGTSMAQASVSARHARRPTPAWSASTRALVGELAILRRPQRASDLDSALLHGPLLLRADPVTSLMRRATSASGQHVYLVPVQPAGSGSRNAGLAVFGIGGGSCCGTAASIQSGGAFSSSGPPNRVLLVVPDGVARVKVTLRTGPDQRKPPRVSAKVRDNVVVFRAPFAVETLSGDPMSWYGPTGHLIKQLQP